MKTFVKTLLLSFSLFSGVAVAEGGIIANLQNSGSDTFFDANASAADLANTGQPTFSSATTTRNPFFGFPGINNGIAASNATDSTFYQNTELSSSLTYTLNTSVNTRGYDVQSIRSLAGWMGVNVTQANQRYEVLVSRVGSPAFESLGTFVNAPFSASSTAPSSTQILLTDSTGRIAANVDAVRFNLFYPGLVGNGSTLGTVYREVDVLGVASTSAPPPFVNLITNGSFESPALAAGGFSAVNTAGAIPGWTLSGEATLVRGTFGTIASDGAQWLSLESTLSAAPNNDGTISQTIATTVGQAYQLDFDYNALGFDGTGNWSFTYNVGEGPVTLSVPDGANLTLGAWLHASDQFIATSSLTTISFSGNAEVGGFFGPAIDNVTLVAIPEPSNLQLWCLVGALATVLSAAGWRRAYTPIGAARLAGQSHGRNT